MLDIHSNFTLLFECRKDCLRLKRNSKNIQDFTYETEIFICEEKDRWSEVKWSGYLNFIDWHFISEMLFLAWFCFIAKLSHKLRKHTNITILNLITEPALLLLIIFENQHLFLQKISSYPSLPFPSISQFHFVMDHFRPLSKPNHLIGSIRNRCLNNYKNSKYCFSNSNKHKSFSIYF